MSNRTVRINELVQREISDILRQRYQAESVVMTVTEVRVAPDLRDARVFVSVLGDDALAKEKLRWLRRQARDIREEVGRRIVLKYLPKFDYVLDRTIPKTVRVLEVIDEITRTEAGRAAPPESTAPESE
jgi:ribosome-binding factor A